MVLAPQDTDETTCSVRRRRPCWPDPATEPESELLVHDISHELGLANFYGFTHDDIHRWLGFWDPMGEPLPRQPLLSLVDSIDQLASRRVPSSCCMKSLFNDARRAARRRRRTPRACCVHAGCPPPHAFIVEARRRRNLYRRARSSRRISSCACSTAAVPGRRDELDREPDDLPDSATRAAATRASTSYDKAPFGSPDAKRSASVKVTVEVLTETANGYRVQASKRR